ncbi:hypothetical protein [uncultured Duncaniella sp.]|uniref:hypothetical protein n=1 Tax=uncultured Duncaniella sp. TaxID=2768039 RepID=UPI002620830F|nr:hypothetical protein [uncultured Duncaniella sp.]
MDPKIIGNIIPGVADNLATVLEKLSYHRLTWAELFQHFQCAVESSDGTQMIEVVVENVEYPTPINLIAPDNDTCVQLRMTATPTRGFVLTPWQIADAYVTLVGEYRNRRGYPGSDDINTYPAIIGCNLRDSDDIMYINNVTITPARGDNLMRIVLQPGCERIGSVFAEDVLDDEDDYDEDDD